MSSSSDQIAEGGCLCGNVRFRADGTPRFTAYCHCRSCRRQTGSPVTTYTGFPLDRVAFSRGLAAVYASSPGVERGFCRRCGTPLFYRSRRWPGEIHLFTCTFDEPSALPPEGHVYFSEHVPGFDVRDDLPRRS